MWSCHGKVGWQVAKSFLEQEEYLLTCCIIIYIEHAKITHNRIWCSFPSVYLARSLGVGNAESSPSQLHYLLPLLWVGT
jgi:hypothetical protein